MMKNKFPACSEHPYAGLRLENTWGKCLCPKCHKHIGWVDPNDATLIARPACSNCGQTGSVHLMRTIQVNGKSLVYWHCEACDKFASQPLPHASVLRLLEYLRYRWPERAIPASIDEIRTRHDYREGEPCFACGETVGTEYHHFLPQAFRHDPRVAPNWERWERCGVNLCRPCHELWHELVAPMSLLAGRGAQHG